MAIPSPQSYQPASKVTVGAVLYSCTAWTDEKGTSTAIDEWFVRSIQAKRGTKSRMGCPTRFPGDVTKYVNITQKVDLVTWGKLSTKHGDYGWLKTIPTECRKQFAVGQNLPRGIYTTVRAAVLYELKSTEDFMAQLAATPVDEMDAEDLTELESLKTQHAALQRRFAKLEKLRTEKTP